MVSVILPAYNEVRHLPRTLSEISRVLESERVQVLIVNDGSTDRTEECVKGFVDFPGQLLLVNLKSRSGQHAAILAGLRIAGGDFVISFDADGDYSASILGSFVDAWRSGAEAVSGKRIGRKPGLLHAAAEWMVRTISRKPLEDPLTPVRGISAQHIGTVLHLSRYYPIGLASLLSVEQVLELELESSARPRTKGRWGWCSLVLAFSKLFLCRLRLSVPSDRAEVASIFLVSEGRV